ncbi:phage integrase Arm DNA-binding domain-containing protein [Pantoea ananatis]|uniref:phage integrase Arm DNA-binding domain-containing protein n=1 Tax=Pantoea ananas TaxID=553 RepID=UPI001B30C98C|nr:phage integrase Arm DNA-binding domain-containing protein [Pantoea ananatis]
MARPRKYNVTIPGLSCFTDARTKRVYWRYKHPVTGKFHGLGTDEEAAKEIAAEANRRLTENQLANLLRAREEIARGVNQSITTQSWVARYKTIQAEKIATGEIKESTVKGRESALKLLVEHLGIKPLAETGTRDVAAIIDSLIARGVPRMAQMTRTVLVDVFKEAQHAGEVPPGFNPALATKKPRAKVTRQRLSFDEWKMIYAEAVKMQPWNSRSMLLALVTGQRLGDIAKMKFADIWDDALHIEQIKTGAKVAIPLSLNCAALGMSLRDVIAECRDSILSPWLLHHHHSIAGSERGGPLATDTITMGFKTARSRTDLSWNDGTPPTFHEQRSLSERLYRAQGVDTQTLLGHKSSKMTDEYNNDRGKDWKIVAI